MIVADPIRLAMLAGLGLRRLGVRRRDLIASGPGSYGLTAAWALALNGCLAAPSGLPWTSRQDDTASALLLFGGIASRMLRWWSPPTRSDWTLGQARACR